MSAALICPSGHRWHWDEDRTLPSPPHQPCCPTCGAPAMRPTPLPEDLADASTPDVDTELPGAPTLPRDSRAPAVSPRIAIPGYEVLEEIGRGGMSVVYRARDLNLGRDVAIKLLLSGVYAHPEQRARFLNEAKALAALQHPNIVQIHAVGEHDGMIFLALEYMAGGSLAQRLRKQVLSPFVAAELVETLARATHSAHARGILHRDLKPGNVLLSCIPGPLSFAKHEGRMTNDQGQMTSAKIADFGLARRLEAEGLTQSGDVLGTPAYMSPEQSGKWKLPGGPGPRTDVYALGAMLYEILVGRPPFRGETALETLDQVVHQEPVPPRQLRPDTPRDLETICLKCLEKHPSRRYETAALLADDLRRFVEHRPVVARPVGRLGRLARWARRNPWPAGLSAGLILVALTGLALVLWQWGEAATGRHRAERAERKAQLRADAEARARTLAEQAQRDTALAVDYLTDTYGRLIKISAERRDEALRAEALRSCEQAAVLIEKLLDAHPSTALRSAATKVLTHLSVLRALAGQRQEAIASALKALDLLRDLSTDEAEGFPTADWGETCFVLGGVFLNLDQPADGITPFTQAVRHFRKTLDAAPSDDKAREGLSKSYFHLGEAQRRAGRIEAAGTAAWNRLQLWPEHPDQIYDVACELARCAAAIGGRSPLSEQQAEARDRFAAAAVDVLRKAVAAGFKDVKGLKADKDLVPLHDREDFQRLVAELERK